MTKHTFTATVCVLISLSAGSIQAADYLAEHGKPRAQIVIAENAPRSTRLAADELQTHIQKISGATLPVTTAPNPDVQVHVYVGESEHTAKLGITVDGLKYGAYRITSGENWLALVGQDKDFKPIEPWAKSNGDRRTLQARWEKAGGLPYGVPNGGMYKNRRLMPKSLAKHDREYLWGFDERGSYNAVCGYLRSLGVRWYLPGELGEVIPKMASIPLPKVNQTVEPDFEIRQFSVRFGNTDEEVWRWSMRLGIRQLYGLPVAHGMHTMTHPEELKSKHPDWFALYGDKRDTQTGKRLNHLCYSNQELFHETVRWARAQFDVYDFDCVSIMPPDAYGSICQCNLCDGKQIDAMGSRGKLSNHVWDFANRVAKEVAKTHPNKLISCCAYGANTQPPTNIDKLEPNIQVLIVGGRRPRNSLPEQQEEIRKLREGWLKKTDRPIIIFENYPFTGRGTYLPGFVARVNGESINATKGVSRGEDIWLSYPRYHDDKNMGFDHFQVYFTARMWWGGKNADIAALLNEYCHTFYGPAGSKMQAFFDYCELNYQAMDKEKDKVNTALAMFDAAKSEVPTDSIYAKRLGLIDKFLNALRNKAKQLAQGRGPVPKMRTVWEPKDPIVIDGKLDEAYWIRHRNWSVGRLRELQTGERPIFGTTVMSGWDRHGQNLYFGIRCEERAGEKVNIATTRDEDQSLWYGDVVEIELATESHSYYQIAVNPAGALVDLDRATGRQFDWQSQAEVATQVADDHWTVEIRIPVTQDQNDPLNQVVGRKPSASLPWFFNVCRQRIRETGSEYSAFAPTGKMAFHVPSKFAHFYAGRSHTFEVDDTVTDFLIELTAANNLYRNRKLDAALNAFIALSQHAKATDYQTSHVLSRAAACARAAKDFELAHELSEQIPLEPISKTAQMENLLAQRSWQPIIDQFGGEDIAKWPFTQIAPAAFARGRAYHFIKAGDKADADLRLALEFTSDPRVRVSIQRTIAHNLETVIKDEDKSLEAYLDLANSKFATGSADYLSSLQAAARILTRRGEYAEAIKVLGYVDANKLGGSWSGSMFLSRGQALEVAGRKTEAFEAFKAVIDHRSTLPTHRKAAEAGIDRLK